MPCEPVREDARESSGIDRPHASPTIDHTHVVFLDLFQDARNRQGIQMIVCVRSEFSPVSP